MTIKGAEVIGIKIIAVKENIEIGIIKDIIYDPKENKVIAFLVSEGDVIVEPKVIPFTEVQDITKEQLLVNASDSVKPGSKAITPLSADESDTYLQGSRIVSKDGKELGEEKDIIFDTKTGNVQEFEVTKNSETKIVKIAKVIVSTDTETIIEESSTEEKKDQSEGILEKLKQLVNKY